MFRAFVVSLLSLCVVATGCAPGSSDTVSGTEAGIDRDASLTLAQIAAPTKFDPHRATSPNSDPSYLQPVYDQLLRLDADLKAAPHLAESYEMAQDGLTMTLSLRDDVHFHDGMPLNAEAVVANLQRAKEIPGSTAAALLENVDSVRAIDPSTVELRFTQPEHLFPYTLAANVNLSSIISPAALERHDLDRNPVGSGPFRLEKLTQDRAVYVRVDNYWGPDTDSAARLEIVSIPDDNARINALQTGQVDVITARGHQAATYRPLVDNGTVTAHSFRGALNGMFLNPDVEPALGDPRVRRAISLAINRDEIVNSLFQGDAEPAYQIYPQGTLGHVPDIETDPYDPDEARRLLAEAGAEDLGFSAILTSSEPSDSIATIVQAQLAVVGIRLELLRYPPAAARSAWRESTSAAFGSTLTSSGDPSLFVENSLLGPDNPGELPQELRSLAEWVIRLPLDSKDREAAFRQLSTEFYENPWHIPVVRAPVVILAESSVVGVEKAVLPRLSSQLDALGLAVRSGV